jgi:anti-anti-sigma regulatory factor
MTNNNGALKITNVSPEILEILEITGFSGFMDISSTEVGKK